MGCLYERKLTQRSFYFEEQSQSQIQVIAHKFITAVPTPERKPGKSDAGVEGGENSGTALIVL